MKFLSFFNKQTVLFAKTFDFLLNYISIHTVIFVNTRSYSSVIKLCAFILFKSCAHFLLSVVVLLCVCSYACNLFGGACSQAIYDMFVYPCVFCMI